MKLRVGAKSFSAKTVFYIIMALAFALLMEFFSILDLPNAFQALKGTGERVFYALEDLRCENMTYEGNHVTCQGDPHIYIENLNTDVHDIEFKFSSLSSSSLNIQVYYETEPESYTEANSTRLYYPENSQAVFLSLEENDVFALRIDIGTDALDSYDYGAIILNPSFGDYVKGALRSLSKIRVLFYFLAMIALICAVTDFKRFKDFVFRYRWALGFAFVFLCTVCKLHGSSIGQLVESHLDSADTSNLWGISRYVRSDEFVVFTEMALSQVKSGFQWFSEIWGYSATDMFMTYGQPVMSLVTIFRPFSAPYILLGAEYGLAFFWSARFIILGLVSFEFGRFLTKDKRRLSLCYAVLMAFSPVVQWWFSINGLVEMLIFGQGAILLLKMYIEAVSLRKKVLCMAGLVLCAGGYIMTLYPAWMVPLAYVFAFCALALLIEKRKEIRVRRSDIFIWVGGILVLAAAMLYIFKTSASTIEATMNTVYPGNRTYSGGPINNLRSLFRGWSSWLWTFTDNSNPCETTDFMSFFPIGLILSLIIIFKNKKRDIYLILLNLISLFLIIFVIFPMPEILAKVTLMSYSSSRAVTAVALVNLMILFRALSLTGMKKKWLAYLLPTGIICTLIGLSVPVWDQEKTIVVLALAVSAILVYLLIHHDQGEMGKCLTVAILAVSLIGGGLVNPVSSGLDLIYRNKSVQAIATLNEEDPGLWAACGNFATANLPAVTGADTLTALRTYPDEQLWKDLGLDGDEEIWNRYAHVSLHLSDYDHAELEGADLINLYLTVDTLEKVGVKYIFSTENQENIEDAAELYRYQNISIWRLG